MTMFKSPNHPLVVWASCFLWLTSMFGITWSLLLFICVGDMLLLTGTDIVNAFVLLSGIIMLPTNVHMLYSIANGKKIDHKIKVMCCPIWLCILWIIIIDFVGALLCIQRIHSCRKKTASLITKCMKQYRSVPKYKHFMDNLQWSLKCCGLNSYVDWFSRDWYDRIRDYEWDPSTSKQITINKKDVSGTDSVPLSCCKSGSCISNYLMELGTYSINTSGCGNLIYRIVMISMYAHLIMFVSIIVIEILIVKYITKHEEFRRTIRHSHNVRHIMSVRDNFDASIGSYQIDPEDSDDMEMAKTLLMGHGTK